jgi:hypothetical protein
MSSADQTATLKTFEVKIKLTISGQPLVIVVIRRLFGCQLFFLSFGIIVLPLDMLSAVSRGLVFLVFRPIVLQEASALLLRRLGQFCSFCSLDISLLLAGFSGDHPMAQRTGSCEVVFSEYRRGEGCFGLIEVSQRLVRLDTEIRLTAVSVLESLLTACTWRGGKGWGDSCIVSPEEGGHRPICQTCRNPDSLVTT